ncbi:MAG: T9SS type A sorting domain-containing protein, partial [Bacteroidota bacterium]
SEIRQIEVQPLEADLDIFPNPANDEITVVGNVKESGLLELYDLHGKSLLAFTQIEELTSNALTIDVGALPEGLYFLKLGNAISKFNISRR